MVVEEKTKNLLILYASKTGNAIDAVERLAREAERRGCPILLISINDFDPSSLPEQEIIIFVVSTTGQVVERGLGDDQHPSGYEVVDAFIKCCNLDPESYIRVHPKDKKENDQSYDLRTALIVPYLASPEERDDLYEYNHKERRTILEVLEDFPSVQMPFECVVSWITPYKRKRIGFFSSWLAKLDPQKRVLIPAWFQKEINKMSSYTEIFGCFIHKRVESFLKKKVAFFAAFSRDQQQKVYVQHKMREQSFKIWNLLTEGESVYVAGSANKMPSDMLLAFEEIVSKEGEVPKEAVVRWLRALEKAGKYHVEAWS
ncbi:putative HEAT repeat-containing protein 5B-like isoform X1 [Capsicum annuum]|uniref:Flavodoxin-like domain-containing protein n=1 Tax=Capsicum annuum TaxID=4072 RepID=A0A2G2ZN29_CAPAN|nr:putative HEAT repeat-containing protein 5B-like isoform X1 [Capsicum annuum]KAF3648782.1 putative HEAT repeat-containing protein 5B-like isoform X1 [Capsicum annuum]PHT83345.1 hypothetical protein T459_11788 [Capsicum annuum]